MAENRVYDSNLAASGDNLHLDTRDDNKQVKVNSRDFIQATGNSIALQSTPNQSVLTTGGVYGAVFDPTVASGIAAAALVGVQANATTLGTATGTITLVKAVDAIITQPTSSARTLTNAYCYNAKSGVVAGTVTTDLAVLNVEASTGVAWTCLAKIAAETGVFVAHTGSGATLPVDAGYLKVKLGSTVYKLALFNNA